MKPQDIRHFPWNRRSSDAWTDLEFRAPVLSFMVGFVASISWAVEWDVTERFSATSHEARGLGVSSVNVRVPRSSPVQPPERADFQQRPGLRLLVLGVTRERDQRRFEVAISFPQGIATPSSEVETLLDRARASLVAAERAARQS